MPLAALPATVPRPPRTLARRVEMAAPMREKEELAIAMRIRDQVRGLKMDV